MHSEGAPRTSHGPVGIALALLLAGCTTTVPGVAAPDPAARAAPPAASVTAAPWRPAPDPAGTFVDPEGRFALVPPQGWSVDSSGLQGTAVVFIDPAATELAGGPFNATVNVFVSPAAADLPATVVGVRAELDGLTDYRPTTDEPVTLVDGTPAHLIGGTFAAPQSLIPLRNVQLFTVHDGSTIVVTGTSPVERWDAHGPVFDASLRTLTVAG